MPMPTGAMSAMAFLRNPRNIQTFTLIRQEPGSRDSTGVFVPGADIVDPDATGSVQPLDGQQRLELPEAERLMDGKCILYLTDDFDSIRPLRIGTSQTDSDIIQYKDIQYAVRVVHDMSDYGHLEIYATRLEGQND